MSDREGILRMLRTHGAIPLDPHEAAMARATIEFVQAHPDCAQRSLAIGHLTGSAWIVDTTRTRVLLTHHRKLNKWLQLGGHADGDLDLCAVALREAKEESGLTGIRVISSALFDLDRHWIPARGDEPAHWHYDCRFLLEADASAPLVQSHESKALAWVELSRVAEINPEESLSRMIRKTRTLAG